MLSVSENVGKLMPLFVVVGKSNVVLALWNAVVSTPKRGRDRKRKKIV